MHTLCLCLNAAKILSEPPINLQMHQQEVSVKCWMLDVALTLPHDVFEKLIMVHGAIWRNINNVLWNTHVRLQMTLFLF